MRRTLAGLAVVATASVTLTAFTGTATAETTPAPVRSTVVTTTAAPSGAAGTTSVISLPYGGLVRSYRLFVPSALPSGPRPLVLMLHGLETTASWMELRGTDVGAAANDTLVAYPEGVGSSWNAGKCCGAAHIAGLDDSGFLAAIVADVRARMQVDPTRIAVGGASNGGVMAYRFACDHSDLVSALFIVASTNLEECKPTQPVSLMHIHGQADPIVPYLGSDYSTISGTPLPAVADAVMAWGLADGCSSAITTAYNDGRTDVPIYSLNDCPAGTYVSLVRSKYMTHTWPVTATDISKTGVNPTAMMWSYLGKVWSTRGTPGVRSTVTSSGVAPGGAAGRTSVIALPNGGGSYRLFVPTGLPSGPRPLVLLLHAAGGSGKDFEQKGADFGAGPADALVAYPDGAGKTWRPTESTDTPFLAAVVEDVATRMHVDGSRVIAGGFATGGSMAYTAACDRPDLFTGVFAVASWIVTPSCVRSQPIDVMHVHGLADTSASFTPVAATLNKWAPTWGCTTAISTTNYGGRSDVLDYRYSSCPSGTSIEAIRSKAMTHSWPVTATEVQKAGVAPSTLLWTWEQSL